MHQTSRELVPPVCAGAGSLPPLSDVDGNREIAMPVLPSDPIQMIEPLPPSQEECPLLDVHPIHAPLRAWRDFFIHIAIIVFGLCIAVGEDLMLNNSTVLASDKLERT